MYRSLKRRGVKMDLDPKVNHQMAREMKQRIEELDNAMSLMRTLRDEMEELFFELFGESRQEIR
jgi:hypothetical protein